MTSKQAVINDAYFTLVEYRKEIGGELPMKLQNLAAVLVDHVTLEAKQKARRIG